MEERILIVDDDITFALMLRTWLSKRGFGVGTASSVAAARTALEAGGFSLVLSDMRLPDEDGIALLQWMAGAGVAAPVIVMTSYAEIQNAVRCMKLGARDYVAKPVNPDELLKKIREALDVPAAPAAKSASKPAPRAAGSFSEQPLNYIEGRSDAARQLYEHIRLVAPTNMSVLVNGASGTGKTITMKVMAESFSDAGVPVFLCDVKGDVAGICAPGVSSEGMEKRIDRFGLRGSFAYKGYPTTFWDIYQTGGHAVRATVSDMGPELLSRILSLTPAQEGILHIVFRIADDKGLLLLDLKDLRAMLNYVSEHRAEYMMTYGNITPQSVAAILRALLPLEQQGGDLFFGEPPLDIYDWMRTDADGRGMVNVLDCVKLVQNPTLYASFLLWMLSELFESLPEAGDLEKPKLVFFFDEAHTLFRDAPAVLVQKIEQTVKLIRSKGVGVFFVTQSPSDIPDAVLAQLSNRVQHALRAYTPAELKAVRVAAQAFRANPAFRAEDAILELSVGEALTSFLDEQGVPTIVQRTKIVCPQSLMGAPEPMARMKAMLHDGMEKYDDAADNLSAYEVLTEQADAAALEKQREEERLAQEKAAAEAEKQRAKEEAAEEKRRQKLEDEERRRAQKLEDEERRRAQKLEDEARRRAERAAEAEQKKLERQREREAAAAKKKAERLQSKIETQLVSAGGRILRRGLLGILKR